MDNETLCQLWNLEGVDNICVKKSIYSDDTPYTNIMPKKVIFNGPATIVMWTDGTKTVVKQSNLDYYDYEKGFAMCVVKKVFGDQYAYIRKMVNKSYKDKAAERLLAKLFRNGK